MRRFVGASDAFGPDSKRSTVTIDPDRLAALRRTKLRSLATRTSEASDRAVDSAFPGGATLTDAQTTWVLIEEDAHRRLGGAVAVALRAGSSRLHVLVDAADEARIPARRAELAEGFDIRVSVIDGVSLRPAIPAPPAIDEAPPPSAELYRPVLEEAGLEVIVEGGQLRGELRGLEVARVVVDSDGSAHLEAGVGRFDREAGAMMRSGMGEIDALRSVIDLVEPARRPGVDHPMRRLVPERWLRTVLLEEPDLVGAESLTAVGSAVARDNLTEPGVASAIGVDVDGHPVIVTASVGVDLEFVPAAADDRLSHRADLGVADAAEARLVLAVPERDASSITVELAARFPNTTVRTVHDDWADR